MEMVGPRLKNSLFWLPQKKMEMPAAVLKKTPGLDAPEWMKMSPGVLENIQWCDSKSDRPLAGA